MTVGELIKQLQKLDPTGDLEVVVDNDRYDYPIDMGYLEIRYVDGEEDEWCGENNPNAEKVISVISDN